jgi:hypothetical protein
VAPGPRRIRVQIGLNVGRMHNLCQASERGIVAEPEFVDKNLDLRDVASRCCTRGDDDRGGRVEGQ